ncbi:unnamed protein product, partial [Phaeothamnion confervicola]
VRCKTQPRRLRGCDGSHQEVSWWHCQVALPDRTNSGSGWKAAAGAAGRDYRKCQITHGGCDDFGGRSIAVTESSAPLPYPPVPHFPLRTGRVPHLERDLLAVYHPGRRLGHQHRRPD